MKNRKSPVGQYIIEGLGDTDDAYDYVQNLLPLIGEVILFFNSLESDLDHILCESISDRSDQKGLLVLHNMMYATKVDLYERFKAEDLRYFNENSPLLKSLVSNLKECGTLRNRVVHANWQYTDNEGYTHVRFKMGKRGLEHELIQFSIESLNQIIERIIETRDMVEEFEEKLGEMYCQAERESINRRITEDA